MLLLAHAQSPVASAFRLNYTELKKHGTSHWEAPKCHLTLGQLQLPARLALGELPLDSSPMG